MQKTQKICFFLQEREEPIKLSTMGGASRNFSIEEEYFLLSEKKEDSLVCVEVRRIYVTRVNKHLYTDVC